MHAESPCNGICELKAQPRGHMAICRGCGRTGAEIARWISMTESERAEATRRASERLFGRETISQN
jgi:predicted Fe-S protein YdhL (DUF1289 family)